MVCLRTKTSATHRLPAKQKNRRKRIKGGKTNEKNLYIVSGIAFLIVLSIIGSMTSFDSPVDGYMEKLMAEIINEEWDQAKTTLDRIQSEWTRRKPWISFNNTYTDIQDFERILAQLNAYVNIQDKPGAAAQAADLGDMWRRFAG